MTPRDPELLRLLLAELERHLAVLERDPPDFAAAKRALHGLKGSVGLAGESELSATFGRLERAVADGDTAALRAAIDAARAARDRLAAGDPVVTARWPEPPPGLVPAPIDPSARGPYAGELGDRLAGIDEALSGSLDPEPSAAALWRHVHTIKGAASAVGDEPMAWFCHGLEERLRAARGAEEVLREAVQWRGVLGGLIDDPEATLRVLRRSRSGAPRRATPMPGTLASAPPRGDEPPRSVGLDEGTIRVGTAALDRVLERVDAMARTQDRAAATTSEDARPETLRRLRERLGDALRLIGPPRPWGAPAAAIDAIRAVAHELEIADHAQESDRSERRASEQRLRESLLASQRDLHAMRQAPLGGLFARLASAMEAEARRAGRQVVVETRGAAELVDRRIVEQLAEPCLQLARNAVAHGIEPPAVRAAAGKSPAGTIAVGGQRHGSRLSVVIDDDGAGIDIATLRRRARESGVVSPEAVDALPDDTLLALLFLPGFSTRESADLLAGRGLGLDIALAAVQRMAGALHVSSRRGEGFRAVIEVPVDSGFAKVIWVRAGARRYALFASHVRRVDVPEPGEPPVAHLASCLEPDASPGRGAYHVEIETEGERAVVSVDAVGRIEEHVIRPLPAVVAAFGPFVGAIVRPGEEPILAVDAYAVASRVRALSI